MTVAYLTCFTQYTENIHSILIEKVAGIKNSSNAIFKNLLGQLNTYTHIPVISFNMANSIKGLKRIKNRKQLLLLMRTGFKCLKTDHNDIVQPCPLTRHSWRLYIIQH